MSTNLIFKIPLKVVITLVSILSIQAFGQYGVGEILSEQTRGRTIQFCANETGTETIGNLLIPAIGESARVLWLSFFASW